MITFPVIRDIAKTLIYRLLDPGFEVHRLLSYRELIQTLGGPDVVVDCIVQSIVPEIRELEGRTLTRHW